MKINEKLVSLNTETIRTLIQDHGGSYTPEKYGAAEFHISKFHSNEIEVRYQAENKEDKEPESITGKMRVDHKSYSLDQATCKLIMQEVKTYLENRDVPNSESVLLKPDPIKKLNLFFKEVETVVEVMCDPRFDMIIEKIAPKLGKLIGGFTAHLVGAATKTEKEVSKEYKKD